MQHRRSVFCVHSLSNKPLSALTRTLMSLDGWSLTVTASSLGVMFSTSSAASFALPCVLWITTVNCVRAARVAPRVEHTHHTAGPVDAQLPVSLSTCTSTSGASGTNGMQMFSPSHLLALVLVLPQSTPCSWTLAEVLP